MLRKIKIGRYVVEVGNEEKIMFPMANITKGDLISYYQDIAPIMIPYTKGRLISMQRFPNGIGQEGFYQKDAGDYFPAWIKRYPIKKQAGGRVKYITIDYPATLVYLANQACITPHVWLSRVDKLNYPDRMIFDLDPSKGVGFPQVRWTAKQLKKILDELQLPTFVMTTGSRGVHVVVPLKRVHDFEYTREFVHDIAHLLAAKYPKKITIHVRKAKRGKRVFVDWLRNAFGQTGVAPYAVRPREGAPIATPITWDELYKKGVTSQQFTIKNIFRRMSKKQCPWKNINKSACTLKKARKKLDQLREYEGVI